MEILKVIGTDAALFLFCAAGLVATTVAIVVDTRSQAARPAERRAPGRTAS